MGWKYRTHETLRDTWRIVVRKHKSKMFVGRSRHECDDNIKMDLQKRWEGVEWLQTTQDKGEWREFVNIETNTLCI